MKTKSISDKLMNTNVTKKEKKEIGKHVVIVNCTMSAIITVLVCMVFSFIKMLFASAEDGRREAFFNTLYFEATTLSNGNTNMQLGVTGRVLPIIVAVICVFALYYGMYRVLEKNKK